MTQSQYNHISHMKCKQIGNLYNYVYRTKNNFCILCSVTSLRLDHKIRRQNDLAAHIEHRPRVKQKIVILKSERATA